jgi:hypothetical protein
MGAAGVASILRAFSCDCCTDCSRYVLNSAHLHSRCCSGFCELSIDTDEIEVPAASDSEHEELEVVGCMKWSRG